MLNSLTRVAGLRNAYQSARKPDDTSSTPGSNSSVDTARNAYQRGRNRGNTVQRVASTALGRQKIEGTYPTATDATLADGTPYWLNTQTDMGDRYGSGGDLTNDYDNLFNSYTDDQSKSMLASLRSAFDQQRTDLYAQKPMIQQEAQDMRNQTDTNYYQSLPELYKAMESGGQRGGENITGIVGLNTVRGQGMNNANLYESNQLRNITNAINNLGSQEAQSIAEAQAGINADTFSARLQSLRDAASTAQRQREQEYSDYINNVGAFADDYMQEINNLTSQGVSVYDPRILALRAARNQKITNQNAAAYEASQDAEQNALAWARINKSGSGGGDTLSYNEALIAYNSGDRTEPVLRALGLL